MPPSALLGWLGLGWGLARVQGLQQAEESGGFTNAAELDAEGLDLDEQVLDVDDLVSNQRLQEDADQPDQAVLEGRGESDRSVGCGQQHASPQEVGVRVGHDLAVPACTCL